MALRRLFTSAAIMEAASRTAPVRTAIVPSANKISRAVLDEVAFATGKTLEPFLTSERDIDQAIDRHLGVAAQQHHPLQASAHRYRRR